MKPPLVRHFVTALTVVVLAGGAWAGDPTDEPAAAKGQVKGRSIVATIDFLASKHCRGRETGEPGMDVAIKYITTSLTAGGVAPAGEFGSFLQSVPLQRLRLGSPMFLDIEETASAARVVRKVKLEAEFLPIDLSAEKEVSGEVVFAGYGITAPEHKYDDYEGLNAAGKIVLALRHEPRENDEGDLFEGRKMSSHGTLLGKILNAQKHGAVALLVVNDPLNHRAEDQLTGISMGGTYYPQLWEEKNKKDEDFRYMRFRPGVKIAGDTFGVKIPAVAINPAVAAYLLGDARPLASLQESLDKSLKPAPFGVAGKRVSLAVRFDRENLEAANIVAKVEGSDPVLKDEFVVIGAHYDHMGKDNRGQVFGGADDNASGTAAVIELARAFQSMPVKPKRTMVFLLFCGEELGLLGSRYYTDHPLFPLEKTVAMIDLDMIGRNAMDQLCVLGKYQFPKLFGIVEDVNRASVNFEVNLSVEAGLAASDHYPFMRHGVPAVMFITGLHDEYHRPEDTAGRILPDKIEKVAHLAMLTMWKLSELPAGAKLN